MTRVAVKPAIVWHGSYAADRSDVPEPWLHKAIAAAILFGRGFLIDSRILTGASNASITRAMKDEKSGLRRMIGRQYVQVMDVKPASPDHPHRPYRTIEWPAPYAQPIAVPVENKKGFFVMHEGTRQPEESFGVLPSGGPTPPGMVCREDEKDAAMFLERLSEIRPDNRPSPAREASRNLAEKVRDLMNTVVVSLGEAQFEHLLTAEVCDPRGVRNESEDRRQGIMRSLATAFDSLIQSSAAISNGHQQDTEGEKVCLFLEGLPSRVSPIVEELTAGAKAEDDSALLVIRTIDVLGSVACW
ncbi:MAG: hypothetical protein ACKO23_06670 [Gemmataceae bacterium]